MIQTFVDNTSSVKAKVTRSVPQGALFYLL